MNDKRPLFTPGPWRFVEQLDLYSEQIRYYVCCGKPSSACPDETTFPPNNCICGLGREPFANANDAKLIAIAPEMYELLELLAKRYKPDSATRQRIDALLAKARGDKA